MVFAYLSGAWFTIERMFDLDEGTDAPISQTYTAPRRWEDGEYVGLCAEFPSLSWLAPTTSEAVVGIERVVDQVVADMTANGEKLQHPADRER
jgi:predicted RNase H-like HicB family nuclease